MSSQAAKRSPYKSSRRTFRENQLASPKYSMEQICNPTVTVKTYVHEIKAVHVAIWNHIAKDVKVQNALSAVATMGYSNSNEFHHATSYLLNCISNAYLDAQAMSNPALVPAQAIVFGSARNKLIPGDYLGADIKPDLHAFASDMATLATALRASGESPFGDLVNFPLNLSFGEWKRGGGGLGQLLWYLSALKRARPDLPTVTGLFLDASKRLVLVSVNACGSWASDPVNIGFKASADPEDGESEASTANGASIQDIIPAADTWIAYVVLLYQAHAGRDTWFSLRSSTADPASAQWQVTVGNFTPTVRPFHATLGPGRMSWASFALGPSPPGPASPSIANGFLKTSWQDIEAKFHESSLLERAHEDTWLPGLVRPWFAVLDPSRRISLHDPPVASHSIRQAELVYLASLGQPLSQCRSALHFLKTIYDAAETHWQLINRGILHGDMSWFNILCNPWHDNATVRGGGKQVAEGIPCIDYILTGVKESQPCALVLDLDHAADIQALYDSDYAGRHEKTGTPMFISIELSSRRPAEVGTTKSLTHLAKRLGALDERPQLLKRAFPGGDHDFMQNFHRVVQLEKERMDAGTLANTSPDELHKPRHDVESLYWILVWGFSRACPSGQDPHGKANDTLSRFVETMLNHCMDEDDDSRVDFLAGTGIKKHVFHELFHDHYYPMLADLATYFAIPWHRYQHVHESHAHVAIRRLLLPLIHDIFGGDVADICFNTAQPRTAVTDSSSRQVRLVPSNRGSHSFARAPARASVRPSARASERASTRASAQVSERPIRSNSRCEGTPAAMLATPSPQPAASSAASVPRTGNGSNPDDIIVYTGSAANLEDEGADKDDPVIGSKRGVRHEINEREDKRAKKDKGDSRDVDTLIKMFWDDRTLWFGSGFRNQVDARTVAGPSGMTI